MEFLQLKYFQHAAKTENFSHTAAAFMVPASSVSSSIKKLESELQTALFAREANRLSLNENGKLFLKTVNTILDELTKAKAALANNSETFNGKINLLIHTNRTRVMQLISEFRKQHPQVSFSVDFTKVLNYSHYDLVVTDAEINSASFTQNDFVDEEIVLAVHKSNPLSEKKKVTIKELENEKFLCLYKTHSMRQIMDNLFKNAEIAPKIILECDDPQCIKECLKAGMGVCLVPTISWENQFDRNIALIHIDKPVYRSTKIYVSNNAPKGAEVLLEYMKRENEHSS